MTASKSTSETHAPGRGRAQLTGLAAALLALAAIHGIGLEATSRPLFDLWQRLSPRTIDTGQVAVVSIDDVSIRDIGPWPWSRGVMALLIERIAAQGARVIGVDILMPDPDRSNPPDFAKLYPEMSPAAAAEISGLPSKDSVLAQVVGNAPVVLGRGGLDSPDKDPEPAALAVEAQFAPDPPKDIQSWTRALPNIPEIDDVAMGHGLLNANPDSDGTVRRIPLIARVADRPIPGFALEIARVAAGIETIAPIVERGRLTAVGLGDRRLAVDPDGSMRLHVAPYDKARDVSALALLHNRLPAKTLDKKIVLIGLSAAGTADIVATPLADRVYGTAVQAATVDAILAGDSLSRPWWSSGAELALTALLVAALAFGLPRLRPLTATAIALVIGLGVFAVSWLAFSQAHLLLDPVRPVLVGLAAGAATLMLLFADGRRHQQRLQAALLDERLAAARSAGELAAARDIQLGMLPSRETLQGLDPRIELEGLIEPARSIGGDFYDVVRLDEDRISVLIGDVTGKGVPAALFMALSKALTRSVLLRGNADLAMALGSINDEIARDNVEEMFVTMFVAVLDARTGTLDYCSAGHDDPWRVSADGRVSPLTSDGGPPLAVMPGFPYAIERTHLADGEAIIIVSDGIAEAQDPDGGFFGAERLAAVLGRWGNRGDIGSAGHALRTAVRQFEASGEPTDDLTVLALRYRTGGK